MRRLRSDGGRPRAKYPENADVHGRLRAARFDVPPPSGAGPSLAERARTAFANLDPNDQALLNGWLASNITPEVPRAGMSAPDAPPSGVLYSRQLADEILSDTGRVFTPLAVAGALIQVLYLPVVGRSDNANIAVGAKYKDGN